MKIAYAVSTSLIILLTGCGGGTNVSIDSTDAGSQTTGEGGGETTDGTDDQTDVETPATPDDLIAMFAGATFVSQETLETGPIPTGVSMGNWSVSFTSDTVEWRYSDVIEVGTYAQDSNANMVASFSGRDIPFSGNGTTITWNERTYLRLDDSFFDDQESLVSHYDGSIYTSVEELDIGENAQGGLAMGRWSVRFEGNELDLRIQDTVQRAGYNYANNSAFNIDSGSITTTAYALVGDQLLINSVVYELDSISQFDSQESLVAYLDGTSYQSAGLQQTGTAVDGVVGVGHWYLNFTRNTFTWDHTVVQEAGTYTYQTGDSFTAILADRELNIELDQRDIIWDGVRYVKQ